MNNNVATPAGASGLDLFAGTGLLSAADHHLQNMHHHLHQHHLRHGGCGNSNGSSNGGTTSSLDDPNPDMLLALLARNKALEGEYIDFSKELILMSEGIISLF